MINNLIGRRFGKLIVLKDSGKRYRRAVLWECRCDCGNIIYKTGNNLLSGNNKSCGCGQQERYNMKTHNNSTFIEGTEIGLLSDKPFKSNTSGVRGVSFNKKTNKYRAYITFKRKNYWLGTYDNIKDAIKARKKAEDNLFKNFLKWYEENKK